MEKTIILVKNELTKEEEEELSKRLKDFLGADNVLLIFDYSDTVQIHKIITND